MAWDRVLLIEIQAEIGQNKVTNCLDLRRYTLTINGVPSSTRLSKILSSGVVLKIRSAKIC